MMTHSRAFLVSLLFILIAVLLPTASSHGQEIKSTLSFDPTDQNRSQLDLEVRRDDLTIEARIQFDTRDDNLIVAGSYELSEGKQTDQGLEFSLFSADDESLESPLASERLTSPFKFSRRLEQIGIPKSQGDLWLSIEAPEKSDSGIIIELKAVPRDPVITPVFSWAPSFLPNQVRVWLPQVFTYKSVHPEQIHYRGSVDSYYTAPEDERLETPRIDILPEDSLFGLRFIRTEIVAPHTGRLDWRSTFVWDGVKWYHWPDEGPPHSSKVLSLWSYSLVALLSFLPVLALYLLARRSPNWKYKTALYTIASLASIAYTLEFLTALLPYLLILAIASTLLTLRLKFSTKTYWQLLLFVVSQEYFWSYPFKTTSISLNAFAISILMAALLLAPIALLKHKGIILALSGIMVAGLTAYYLSLDLYISYFEDYPALNVLSYSNQGAYVTDSAFNLLREQHNLSIASAVWCLLIILASLSIDIARSRR